MSKSHTGTTDDVQVPCTCQSQLLPLIQPSGEVTFVQQVYKVPKPITTSRKKLFEGHSESYNLVNGQKGDKQDITKSKESVCPRMLSYLNMVTILGSDSSDTDAKSLKVELYQLKSEAYFLVWDPVLCSAHKFSSSQLNLNNAACVSSNEAVVVVSVLKLLTIPPLSEIMLHLFTVKNTSGGHWRSASVKLRQSGSSEYKIQSCIVVDDNLYCSLLLPETGAYIYKVNLTPLKQCTTEVCKDILLHSNWPIVNKYLQSCFLAMGPNKAIFSIAFYNENARTVMNVEKLYPPTSSHPSHFEFPAIVKPIAASVVTNFVIAIYHDDNTKQCYAKKVIIVDN